MRHQMSKLKVSDGTLAPYIESDHDRIKKGVHYEELNIQPFEQNRVSFMPSDEVEDWYKFKKLAPYSTFDELFEGDDTHETRQFLGNIKQYLKQSDQEASLTAVQSIAFPHIKKAEYDVMIRAQSGSGKTLAYAIPIIYDALKARREENHTGQELYSLIVAPCELCQQIYKKFAKLSEGLDIKIRTSYGPIKSGINELASRKGINIWIVDLPNVAEYFLEREDLAITRTDKWSLQFLRYLVLHEASHFLGYAGPEIEKTAFYRCIEPLALTLYAEENALKDYRLIMTSSYPDITYYSEMPLRQNGCLYVELGDEAFPDICVEQRFILSAGDSHIMKKKKLVDLIESLYKEYEELHGAKKVPQIIIFVNDSKDVSELAESLRSKYSVGHLTEFLSALDQMDVINEFKEKMIDILITTGNDSHGTKFEDVDFVVNYDLPRSTYHAYDVFADRIGRCGRLGNSGKVISFFDPHLDGSMASQFIVFSQAMPSFYIPDFISKRVSCGEFVKSVIEIEKIVDKQEE